MILARVRRLLSTLLHGLQWVWARQWRLLWGKSSQLPQWIHHLSHPENLKARRHLCFWNIPGPWIIFLRGMMYWNKCPLTMSRSNHWEVQNATRGRSFTSSLQHFLTRPWWQSGHRKIPRIYNYLGSRSTDYSSVGLYFPRVRLSSRPSHLLLPSVLMRTSSRQETSNRIVYLKGGLHHLFFSCRGKGKSSPNLCYKGALITAQLMQSPRPFFHVYKTFQQNKVKWNIYFFQITFSTATEKDGVYWFIPP